MKNLLKYSVKTILAAFSRTGEPAASNIQAYVDVTNLAPPNMLLHMGSTYGGWKLPADIQLHEGSTCYLVGAGEDISFDCALASRFHCQIKIIDPTPRATNHFLQLTQAVQESRKFSVNNSTTDFYDIDPTDFARISFLPVGLFDKNAELKFFFPENPEHVSCSLVNLQKTEHYFTAQCYRLSSIMEMQGDTLVSLLKLDVEGAEYAILDDLLSHDQLPSILLVEFDEAHTPLDSKAGIRIANCIRKLVQRGYICVAIDGCNATFRRA